MSGQRLCEGCTYSRNSQDGLVRHGEVVDGDKTAQNYGVRRRRRRMRMREDGTEI